MRQLGVLPLVLCLGACGGDDSAAFDAGPPPDAVSPDAAPGVPITWPSSPDTYAGALVGYLYKIDMPAIVDDVPTCCRDFGAISKDNIEDGTDLVDNALARLTASLGDAFDLQSTLAEAIQKGDLVLLLDHRELDGDPDTFVLAELFGAFDNGTSYDKGAAGKGSFLVLPATFVDGTGEPQNVFNPAYVSGGAVHTGPDTFVMGLPFGTKLVPLPIQDTLIQGQLEKSAAGATYPEGTAAGYFLLSDLFRVFNDTLLSPDCACLGITDPVYVEIAPGIWDGNCVEDAETRCTGVNEDSCKTLADVNLADGICGVGPAIFTAMADIDLDGDPSYYEAVSVGFVWHAVPAHIAGAAKAVARTKP